MADMNSAADPVPGNEEGPPTDDQPGDTIPLRVTQDEPIHDTQGFLLKESFESRSV